MIFTHSSRSFLVALSLVAVAVSSAFPASAAPHAPRLLEILSLIDVVPTAAQLREAGAGPDGAGLVAVARDRGLKRYVRMRAASALAAFDSPEVRAGLSTLAETEGDDVEVRLQALAALTHLEKARVVPRLSALLAHAEPELRAGAIRNLSRVGGPRAREALQRFVGRGQEETPWVRALAEDKLRGLALPR